MGRSLDLSRKDFYPAIENLIQQNHIITGSKKFALKRDFTCMKIEMKHIRWTTYHEVQAFRLLAATIEELVFVVQVLANRADQPYVNI